jgi:hypothetical protein
MTVLIAGDILYRKSHDKSRNTAEKPAKNRNPPVAGGYADTGKTMDGATILWQSNNALRAMCHVGLMDRSAL